MVWMMLMNVVYARIAQWLNHFENHRTESAAENSLILKTILFQFCNTYGALE